jgi:sugar lactone lactonase YvrE
MQTELEIIADDGNRCGEGPLWDDRDRALYWTDITGRCFYRYLRHQDRHERLSDNFEVGGFSLQQDGGFLVTNSHGIWFWRPGEAATLLATEAEGQECVMNDCSADPEGRVYSGSFHLDGNGQSAPSFLFRIDTDGSVHVADEGISFSNGLAFSPGEEFLYFADSAGRCIYRYDWRRRDGQLSNRRVFARIDRAEGLPDGLAVDADGFVWCAHWFGGCLTRYDPDGYRERRIEMPASQTSSLTFGGSELDEIYVTTAAQPNALVLAPVGHDPSCVFNGGPLYRFRCGIRGQLKYRSSIAHSPASPLAQPAVAGAAAKNP